jgi:starch phosphorylase
MVNLELYVVYKRIPKARTMNWKQPTPFKNNKSALERSIAYHLRYSLGKEWSSRKRGDLFLSLALSIRDRLIERMLESEARVHQSDAKRLYYLSMEFLMGRALGNNLHNLGIYETCKEALLGIGLDLEELREEEQDAALGNGGLGRLAACFLDSLATLNLPGYGYGIHYEYGLFKQEIYNGYQKEQPDKWLSGWTPWEIERSDEACIVPLYGRVEHGQDRFGNYNPMWLDWKDVIGVPFDIPIAGYGGQTVNFLRLYAARSSSEFDIQIFNEGDYFRAVEQKISSETISKVLYPTDVFEAGKELRLIQEYFLVACALRDIVRRYLKRHDQFDLFPEKVAIQLNDTHPSLAVAELMRILVDEHHLPWEKAWKITQKTLAFTNHTLLPESLEKWPIDLMEYVIPRHVQIIYEINHRFLREVASLWPNDVDRLRRMSLIEEGGEKKVRMAHLAIVGSHSVNGVSAVHTQLLKENLIPDFCEHFPNRFNNKTNGVSQRRWLLKANTLLSELITRSIGDAWITDFNRIRQLESYADDEGFQEEFLKIKRANKERLRKIILDIAGVEVRPDTFFDVQAKRIHEYKRQLLNVMHIIHEYLCLIEDQKEPQVPRTYIFAGKAPPGYWAAKQIIKLIHNVGQIINRDGRAKDLIKVVFVPDYRVSLAEKIIPAADLSEQISTAGKEASGTGNMKFAMNGAVTIGTLDGANIEIQEEVGKENIYIFGLRVEEIQALRTEGSYQPWDYYHHHSGIRRVMDALRGDLFCPNEPGLFRWIFQRLLDEGDEYFHLADFPSYIETHEKVEMEYRNSASWAKKAILNVARMGRFSSDRTVLEYAQEIWNLT